MNLNRRQFVAAVGGASIAGCTEAFDGEENGRLDLTVGNERIDPVSVRIEVVDEEGTRYEDESDRIGSTAASLAPSRSLASARSSDERRSDYGAIA